MRSAILVGASIFGSAFAAAIPAALGSPSVYPALTDKSQLPAVFKLARGSLSNAPPPPQGALSADAITSLQFIEFNELFESAFFLSLLANVTNNVPGFQINDQDERNYVIDSITAIVAQEELHAINADNALRSQLAPTIQPCTYKYGTTSFVDAITFAALFTDVVLGTLQDVIQLLAISKDVGLTRGVAASLGQEGQQSGFFRLVENRNKIPSEQPFLTTSTRDFAFSALQQNVIVSCPNDSILKNKLKLYAPLNVLTTNIPAADQTLNFSIDINTIATSNVFKPASGSWSAYGKTFNAAYDWSQTSIVYINSQNLPVVVKPTNVKVAGTVISFSANFPQNTNLMNGLTLAALTHTAGPFPNASSVADATLFGPGLIEVN
ncbi:hypothetical protein BT63DRAFT_482886 [Microthyrium microscopicum]|uniref:Late sexual development protein n=1 Tax=Microthyrium microscopicum TaxID=703497 RepID=A0A6A6U0M4_9PEZI|nr:hypothetical protein BT63DRAFT_482886 [Microthyrium microscopicum]